MRLHTLIALLFLISATPVSAQIFGTSTPIAKPVRPACELEKALDALLKVKDSALTGAERDKTEFAARKDVLTHTVYCSEDEMAVTSKKLDELKLEAKSDIELRVQLLTSLKERTVSLAHYGERTATTTGLTDVKLLAEEMLAWRASAYLPLLSQINDFTLLVQSEQSIDTAASRLEKIATALSILRLAEQKDIKSHLYSARVRTAEAKKHAAGARTIVLTYLAPSISTSTTLTTSSSIASIATPTGSSTIEEAEEAPSVSALLKDSLASLREAYGHFLDISALVRKILGL